LAKRSLAIGLVGCGRWGRYILRDLLILGCEVFVVANSDRSRKNAVECKASAIVSSIDTLPSVAGVVVASPTNTHAAVIKQLLHRNVPIFVEKPLANDVQSAMYLAEMAPDRLFVMDKWRYHPGVEMLVAIARTKELGAVKGLRTIRTQWHSPHRDVDVTWILAPHDLSIALEILGSIPQPHSAFAAQIDGMPISLVGIFEGDPWFIMEIAQRSPAYRREVQLHCQDGVAILKDGYSQYIEVTRVDESDSIEAPKPDLRHISAEFPLLRELRTFVNYLEGGSAPRSSATEGALVVSTIAKLRELAGLGN
jgi:predicted dehydrogenase